MASFFVSALLGAVRQVLFNAAFGAGAEASAYYAAFRLPDTLFSLIAGGALSSAMIPVLLRTTREEGEEAGRRLTNLILTALLAVFALVVLIGELFTPLVRVVFARARLRRRDQPVDGRADADDAAAAADSGGRQRRDGGAE